MVRKGQLEKGKKWPDNINFCSVCDDYEAEKSITTVEREVSTAFEGVKNTNKGIKFYCQACYDKFWEAKKEREANIDYLNPKITTIEEDDECYGTDFNSLKEPQKEGRYKTQNNWQKQTIISYFYCADCQVEFPYNKI